MNGEENRTEYQVLARRYRPQRFSEILGQDVIVTTLKNAIKHNRLANAYLFSGPRGCGKTTLARCFAKALNCPNPLEDFEPCNQCSICKEISAGVSFNVREIDGASNRGIDDIRKINETVGYSTGSLNYKIYIIDEVHMLTKEAFNALLKTLEEPPSKVKFFFATTEPHKVLPTIVSRCQRFNLNRIPQKIIVQKLQRIAHEMHCSIEDSALQILSERAEGLLRDAESLLDQVMAFHDNEMITEKAVSEILGIMLKEAFFEIDLAGKEGRLSVAFDIVDHIFKEGKDLGCFLQMLTEHIRTILLIKLGGMESPQLVLTDCEKTKYRESAKLYRKDQCLELLDYLIETAERIRYAISPRMTLEGALLHVMRSHYLVPVDILVKRLSDLEAGAKLQVVNKEEPMNSSAKKAELPSLDVSSQPLTPPLLNQESCKDSLEANTTKIPTEDNKKSKGAEALQIRSAEKNSSAKTQIVKPQYHYDTLLQFAAVELDGKLQKMPQK